LAERIVKRTGSKSAIRHIPYSEAYEVGFEDMQRRVPSLERAGELIQYTPQIKLDQTIDEVAAHIKRTRD
jgi:UDP-glucose 4-epimerase